MKQILAALCVLTSLHVQAQTNQIGSTGNVGIGTLSPSEKLTVDGNVQIDGSSPFLRFGARFILQHPSMISQNFYVRG